MTFDSRCSLDTSPGPDDSRHVHHFLVDAAVLLHRFGTPSHRLERVMTKVARSLGVEGAFLYTPTALVISFVTPTDEQTFLRRIESGPVDADKLIRFDKVLSRLEKDEISLSEARHQLKEVATSGPCFHWSVTVCACAVSSAAVAIFFRGTALEVLVAASIGLVVALFEKVHSDLQWQQGMMEPFAGCLAAIGSLAVARWICPIDDRLVALASLIVLIPGLQLTVAMTELAVGHLSAGTARAAGALSKLLTLMIGVAIGWRVFDAWRTLPDVVAWKLPEYWQWIAAVVAPMTFAIVFRARMAQWPVIIVITVLGFVTSRYAGEHLGIEVGAFSGALVVGCGSNLYARLRDRPALVPLTPGIIVLVPGSLGYRSLTSFLQQETLQGIDLAFAMVMVAMALVGGILTSNAVISPRRIL